MNEILLAIGFVVILLIILIILFSFTIKRVNVLMKKTFVDKLQIYDYLIDDKEKKIVSLTANIDKKLKSYTKLEKEVYDLERTLENVEEIKIDEVILPTDADFEDGDILSCYKKIKNGFNFDVKDKIIEFLDAEKKNDTNFQIYCNVRKYFNHNNIYKIVTYLPDEQKIIINELLNDEEKNALSKLLNRKKFNIVKFVSELDELILKSDPQIKVFIGNEVDKYEYLDSNIVTIYDKNITEGFKIMYKGVIYDYSI